MRENLDHEGLLDSLPSQSVPTDHMELDLDSITRTGENDERIRSERMEIAAPVVEEFGSVLSKDLRGEMVLASNDSRKLRYVFHVGIESGKTELEGGYTAGRYDPRLVYDLTVEPIDDDSDKFRVEHVIRWDYSDRRDLDIEDTKARFMARYGMPEKMQRRGLTYRQDSDEFLSENEFVRNMDW